MVEAGFDVMYIAGDATGEVAAPQAASRVDPMACRRPEFE
jgi:hypothetical protein